MQNVPCHIIEKESKDSEILDFSDAIISHVLQNHHSLIEAGGEDILSLPSP